jgi:large subunit ribosomal protein L9
MKLILTGEVAGLGAPGDIVEVKDGYGRNFLVPQGLAMRATKGAEKQIVSLKRARDIREVRDLAHAREIKSQLEALKVTLPTRAGAAGRLFGSVTVADVVSAVKAAGGPILDKRKVEIEAPIKTVGTHQVVVRVQGDISAKVALEVTAAS